MERSWNEDGFGVGLVRLAYKLKRLKQVFRHWNKTVFGNTHSIIQVLEERIEVLEHRLQTSYDAEVEQDLLVSKLELSIWCKCEDIRLSQQAKFKWLSEGDQNSKFFHAVINMRKKNVVKEMTLHDGTRLETPEEIHEGAVAYFKDFLGQSPSGELSDLSYVVDKVISEEEKVQLCAIPSDEEMKDALFSIPVESSPGPHGFGSGFFVLVGIL